MLVNHAAAVNHSDPIFIAALAIAEREASGWPPFSFLALLRARGIAGDLTRVGSLLDRVQTHVASLDRACWRELAELRGARIIGFAHHLHLVGGAHGRPFEDEGLGRRLAVSLAAAQHRGNDGGRQRARPSSLQLKDHQPKSSKRMFSGSTPRSSSIFMHAWSIIGGPQR